jgi:transcriptional regulator with XRE-family HTH domain
MKPESAELNSILGKNIRMIRVTRGYSQEYLALKTGVNQSNIQRLESGTVEIRLHVLAKICSVLNVSLYLLLLLSDQNGMFTNSTGELEQVKSILIEILNSENLDESVKKDLAQRILNG